MVDEMEWEHMGAAVRSKLHEATWIAYIPDSDIGSAQAGPLRAVKAYVVEETQVKRDYDRWRWVQRDADTWDLEAK